jgi:hypothetical protein
MADRNIALPLPEEYLREARALAARRATSVSQMLADILKEMVEHETRYDRARERSLARLRHATDLGTGGCIDWSRDGKKDP